MTVDQCMAPENIHTHQSQKKIGNSEGIGGGGGGGWRWWHSKANILKGKYEAKLEIPVGWGGSKPRIRNHLWGMDIFWNSTLLCWLSAIILFVIYNT